MTRILILGGTAEGARIAKIVSIIDGLKLVYSLAGVTKLPNIPNCETRIGGFGGTEGFVQYLTEKNIDRVIDATHPYATRMASHAVSACNECNIPRIKLVRPAWTPVPGDDWRGVANASEAAELVPKISKRVFLATGRKDLLAFEKLSGIWFLLRLVDVPETSISLTNYQLILGRGPFPLEEEISLLQAHKIGVVVLKNSGGSTYAKIEAARTLGLPAIIIDRPKRPEGLIVESIEDVVSWLDFFY